MIDKKVFVLQYNNEEKLNDLFKEGWELKQMSSCASKYGHQCFIYLERKILKTCKNKKEALPDNVEDLPF